MSEERKPTPRKVIMIMIFSVAVAIVGTFIFYQYETYADFDLVEAEFVGEWTCLEWESEAKLLVAKYGVVENINDWVPVDKQKYIFLENNFLEYCTIKKVDVIDDYEFCKELYVDIHILLDKMVERETNSLSEIDQLDYRLKYDGYFRNNCDLLQDDIEYELSQN